MCCPGGYWHQHRSLPCVLQPRAVIIHSSKVQPLRSWLHCLLSIIIVYLKETYQRLLEAQSKHVHIQSMASPCPGWFGPLSIPQCPFCLSVGTTMRPAATNFLIAIPRVQPTKPLPRRTTQAPRALDHRPQRARARHLGRPVAAHAARAAPPAAAAAASPAGQTRRLGALRWAPPGLGRDHSCRWEEPNVGGRMLMVQVPKQQRSPRGRVRGRKRRRGH